jgi:hypothetical protein
VLVQGYPSLQQELVSLRWTHEKPFNALGGTMITATQSGRHSLSLKRALQLGLIAFFAALGASLAASAHARASDECATSTDCFNAAAWQRAVAKDYSDKAAWFRATSKQNFINAYEWNQKATFAFHGGNANAAAVYKAIADDYSRKSVADGKAADDYSSRAAFVNAAAAGNEDRGRWLQSCGDAEICSRFIRPAGLTDSQWFTIVSQIGQTGVEIDSPPETSFCLPGEFCTASGTPTGCKTIKNPRTKTEIVDPRRPFTKGNRLPVIQITFETTWCYKNGNITRMDPPNAHCHVTLFGLGRGWRCANPDGHPVFPGRRTGGNPEHGAWIYSFDIYREVWAPIVGEIVRVQEDRWCAGNQVSASGAHKRHGHCSLQSW